MRAGGWHLWCAAAVMCAATSGTVQAQAPATQKIYVTVTDDTGAPVSSLGADDFAVRVNKTPVRVREVRVHEEAPAIVIVAEGVSREQTQAARRLLTAAVQTIASSYKQAKVGLVITKGEWDGFVNPVTERARLDTQIAHLYDSSEGTPLIESVQLAVDRLKAVDAERRVIVLLTMGPLPTRATANATVDAVRTSGSELWAFAIWPAYDLAQQEVEFVRTIARASGGRFVWHTGVDFEPAFRKLVGLLPAGYGVTFDVPAPPDDPLNAVSVTAHAPERKAGWTLSAPVWVK